MTALSELLPAGGAGKVMDFVASGTLPNGKAVVLKSDGTVEVIAATSVAESIPVGSEVTYNARSTNNISATFDPNTAGKFVVAYRDAANSNYGTSIVGTVSGTSISFGTAVVFNSASSQFVRSAFDPNTAHRFVVTYMDQGNSNYGTAIVGTVSGTSISFGSSAIFNSGVSQHNLVAFDFNTANNFVVAYTDFSNSYYGTAVVGTVSGTTISFGAEYVFNSANTDRPSLSFEYNTANKFVVAYTDVGNSSYGTACIGTVSGTSISFGSEAIFNSAASNYIAMASDPTITNKYVFVYSDAGNSGYGTAIIGDVSGASISFGSEAIYNTAESEHNTVAFDPNTAGKLVIAYRDSGNSYNGTAIVGTVSGTSTSFGSEYVFNSGQTDELSISFDPNNAGKFIVAYRDSGNSGYGSSTLGQISSQVTNLTSTNFVGITTEAISNTATGPITLQGGVSTNQSSLTVGSTYYVQANGTVSTVSTSPAVNIGKALNATTLKLKGLSV